MRKVLIKVPAVRPRRERSLGGRPTPAETMLARLRAAGLKLTPQRRAIVRELASDASHPTAQELFERLLPVLPGMSFATVYNTLGALAEAGLCEARSFGPGPTRFDPNTAPHHHAVCDGCGTVLDVAPPAATPETQVLPTGFRVRAVERVYRGTCAPCARAGARGVIA